VAVLTGPWGLRILDLLAQELAEYAVVKAAPRQDGRSMVMVVARSSPAVIGYEPGPGIARARSPIAHP
jgi:hypothetical protein